MSELPPVRKSAKLADAIFSNVTRAAAVLTLLLLVGIILSLFIGAWPSISTSA